MPKPKVKRGDSCATGAGDPRFANFETDPRFRLPSKKHTKVTIDKRFAGVLRDSEFTETARIDRYGRKIRSDAGKKALRRLYRAEEAEEGEIDNEEIERELQAALKNYDPARGGGFESSSEDEESDGEEVTEVDEQEYRGMQRIQDEVAAAEEGDVTKRIAIVSTGLVESHISRAANEWQLSLDWDNIKSVDLFAMFQSFLPAGGRIEKVSIYPSEFGKQQMALENASGPPREIWRKKAQKSSDSEVESDEDERIKQQLFKEQEGNDQDYDMDRLREYQLDRLK